ncbi:MAG: pteridine reductase [Pseudomonadota bacterium]|nr:pteridine reductase [Pseudomonadota bacterium]
MQNKPSALAGKTVLVTGAARRIGAEIARDLHAAGMNVILHYGRSAAAADALRQELEQQRSNSVATCQADLLDLQAIDALSRSAAEAFGQLDALVNNASTFYPTPVGDTLAHHWDDLVGTNLKAPYFLIQALAAPLRETQGSIVNIVDIHAERPLKEHPVYCAAKAGLAMLTRSLARELAPEVRVNAVAPGAILWPESGSTESADVRTEILNRIPLQRTGAPSDIARTVHFLIAEAQYVTGQIIPVDGGRSLGH